MNVVFFGSDNFSMHAFRRLLKNHLLGDGNPQRIIRHLEVVCPPDSRGGRGMHNVMQSPIKQLALEHNVTVHQPLNRITLRHWQNEFSLNNDTYDFGVVVSFRYLIPSSLLHRFSWGCINVHPSLLPRWRGPAPIEHTVMHGDGLGGVSLMLLDPLQKKFDVGDVLAQQSVQISPSATTPQLTEKLGAMGADMLWNLVEDGIWPWHSLRGQRSFSANQRISQTKLGSLYETAHAPKVQSKDGEVTAREKSAAQIDCLFRAIGHDPGVFVRLKGSGDRMKVLDCMTHPSVGTPEAEHADVAAALDEVTSPGRGIIYMGGKYKRHPILQIVCSDGKPVWIERVQLENRKAMHIGEFFNGHRKIFSPVQGGPPHTFVTEFE